MQMIITSYGNTYNTSTACRSHSRWSIISRSFAGISFPLLSVVITELLFPQLWHEPSENMKTVNSSCTSVVVVVAAATAAATIFVSWTRIINYMLQ
jgi:S-adenosylmethionine:diacylglycerol 3-amino-3-carboxypropyl transferase